jgi:SMC interacting uncharacterized protein involved in chromosome segregation
MRWLKRFPLPKRDKTDVNHRDMLAAHREQLRKNMVWNEEILPMLDRKIDELETEILDGDLSHDNYRLMRRLREELVRLSGRMRKSV